MKILDFCDPDVAAVTLEANVAEAIQLMLRWHVGAVAVVDSEKRVAGIFTERDVLQRVALGGQDHAPIPVRDVTTTPVDLDTRSTRPGDALSSMLERH